MSKQMHADLIIKDKLISDCKYVFAHTTVTSVLIAAPPALSLR